jgi:regulator of sigma E protease
MTLIIFLVVLSLLVLVHEAGHFAAARAFGVKVYEFALGFPPRAFGWYKDPVSGKFRFVWGKGKETMKNTIAGDEPDEQYPSTLYAIHWLPLGGFVRIKGENGERANEPDSFGAQKAWKRLVILCAGVVMNIVFAALVLSVGFMTGLPTDVTGVPNDGSVQIRDQKILVTHVESGSPADEAGIGTGYAIISVAGLFPTSSEMARALILEKGNQGIPIALRAPDGAAKNVMVTPKVLSETDATPRVGVVLSDIGIVQYPFFTSLWKGFVAAIFGLINIFVSLWILIVSLFGGAGASFDVAGPVGIAGIVGDSARMGFAYLLNVTAMISLSLAAMNILPIPALDGGRALFVLIEMVTRKKVSMRFEQLAHTAGFVALMILIVFVTWKDIVRLFS